jgi:hypothetical protein
VRGTTPAMDGRANPPSFDSVPSGPRQSSPCTAYALPDGLHCPGAPPPLWVIAAAAPADTHHAGGIGSFFYIAATCQRYCSAPCRTPPPRLRAICAGRLPSQILGNCWLKLEVLHWSQSIFQPVEHTPLPWLYRPNKKLLPVQSGRPHYSTSPFRTLNQAGGQTVIESG